MKDSVKKKLKQEFVIGLSVLFFVRVFTGSSSSFHRKNGGVKCQTHPCGWWCRFFLYNVSARF